MSKTLGTIFSLVICVLVSACIGSAAKKEFFYTLDKPQVTQFSQSSLRVALSMPQIAAGYANQRIAFREKNNEIQYYGYRRWAAAPDKLIQEAIAAHLMYSKKFAAVDASRVAPDAAIIVDTSIDALEEIDTGGRSFAHLAAQFRVRRKGEDNVAARYFFDKQVEIEKQHPKALSDGISKLLAQHCEKLATVISTVGTTTQ